MSGPVSTNLMSVKVSVCKHAPAGGPGGTFPRKNL